MNKKISPYFHTFKHDIDAGILPGRLNYPFSAAPHIISKIACKEVQNYLETQKDFKHDFGLSSSKKSSQATGKMFGVLVVKTQEGRLGFLAAYSGQLAGTNSHKYFVPPVYDIRRPNSFFKQEEAEISKINEKIKQSENSRTYIKMRTVLDNIRKEAAQAIDNFRKEIKTAKKRRGFLRKKHKDTLLPSEYEALLKKLGRESQDFQYRYKDLRRLWSEKINVAEARLAKADENINRLKNERKKRSAALQKNIFEHYTFLDAEKRSKSLQKIFIEELGTIPPAGAGECAAPKLFQYAFKNGYTPISLAEFWWGAAPNSEVRKHKNYYPCCKGKCAPILNYMLRKTAVEKNPMLIPPSLDKQAYEIIYEDEAVLVLNKSENFLSVPGKHIQDSIQTRVQSSFTTPSTPLPVHRLDMATSGLMLFAKNKTDHSFLQKQFLERKVHKEYTAVLEGSIVQDSGRIDLPLRVDLNNRPYQLICKEYGKPALTYFRVIERNNGLTRIKFYPVTGRTHQLRVHAAHQLGLATPIRGDDLYGSKADRLYLHAEKLIFIHPKSQKKISITAPCPF